MTLVRTVQLGPCLVRIETDDQVVHRLFRYLDHRASQPSPPSNELSFRLGASKVASF